MHKIYKRGILPGWLHIPLVAKHSLLWLELCIVLQYYCKHVSWHWKVKIWVAEASRGTEMCVMETMPCFFILHLIHLSRQHSTTPTFNTNHPDTQYKTVQTFLFSIALLIWYQRSFAFLKKRSQAQILQIIDRIYTFWSTTSSTDN